MGGWMVGAWGEAGVPLPMHLRDALREAERHVVHLPGHRLADQGNGWACSGFIGLQGRLGSQISD